MQPTQKNITLVIAAEHPAFAGHFPGMPITPGVVLLDKVLSALADHLQQDFCGCRLTNIKFLHPVVPDAQGKVLTLNLQYETNHRNDAIHFSLLDANRIAASGTIHVPV